jgi:hypothetical protein
MGKIHQHDFDYRDVQTKNLYKFYLQREVDIDGKNNYSSVDYSVALECIIKSEEYENLKKYKSSQLTYKLNKKLDYTIIKINDRAVKTLELLHQTVNGNYHNIKFIDYNVVDINNFFSSRNINIHYIGDLFGLSKYFKNGELACAASHIVAMEYLLDNDLEQLMVFEDDIILEDKFKNILPICLKDLPDNYDFMADSSYMPNYQEISTVEDIIDIGSKFICKAYLQNSHTGFMLYSKSGAKNILNLYRKYGFICPIDTFLFWLNRRGDLKGYTTFYSNKLINKKDIYESLIV